MVSLHQVEEQLRRVGCNFRVWGRSEIHELTNILMPDETIAQCVNGTYEGGFAMLCVTQYRVLLVDRKPMLLTLEDLRYDMIAEVDLTNRLLNSTIRLMTPMHNLVFNSWSHHRLRKALTYIQQRVMEVRQVEMGQFQQQLVPPPRFNVDGHQEQPSAGAIPAANNRRRPPMNPYTKVPLLTRRRRFPSYY